jgi:hypothetical protein
MRANVAGRCSYPQSHHLHRATGLFSPLWLFLVVVTFAASHCGAVSSATTNATAALEREMAGGITPPEAEALVGAPLVAQLLVGQVLATSNLLTAVSSDIGSIKAHMLSLSTEFGEVKRQQNELAKRLDGLADEIQESRQQATKRFDGLDKDISRIDAQLAELSTSSFWYQRVAYFTITSIIAAAVVVAGAVRKGRQVMKWLAPHGSWSSSDSLTGNTTTKASSAAGGNTMQ